MSSPPPLPPLPNPLVWTAAGVQPQQPAALLARIIAYVSSFNAGFTATLPASMIEDITSTEVAAAALCDQAWIDLVNSLAPLTANPYLLNQLGQIYGPIPNTPTNTSVFVQFFGTPGYVIKPGFIVSDGTYQYIVQDGGIIATSGSSAGLYSVATVPGSWAVPPNTVTELGTSVPAIYTLTCTNPSTGIPGLIGVETEQSYRARVLQAGLAAGQGTPALLRTMLGLVSGVQTRLIGNQLTDGLWKIIVGGGDPYQVAYAIYQALGPGIAALSGSILAVTGITRATNAVVTTSLNHGYATGQIINIAGVVGMTEVNGVPYTITVLTETTFELNVNSSGYTAYVSGGVVTPNFRNVVVDIIDFPDTYAIPFVVPPQQTVQITLTWNTTATNFISADAVAQLGSPALVNYVVGANIEPQPPDLDPALVAGVYVGQPLNQAEMEDAFKNAIASLIPGALVSRMVWAVSINNVSTSLESGTVLYPSDVESYFYTDQSMITIIQG